MNIITYNPSLPSIKGKLQYLWTANTALTALHPVTSFYTGRVPSVAGTNQGAAVTEMPYTRLEMPSGSLAERTSDSNYLFQVVKFHLWTDTAEEADPIANAIEDCFADVSFSYNSGRVIDTKSNGVTQKQIVKPNYTAYETIVTFTMRIMRNRVH